MLVFFATLILLATLLYLWKTRARLCKFCHPFYQSLWHFLPVQVFSGEMTPAHLAVVQHNAGAGASPSDGARQPRSHNRARQTGCSRHRGRAGLRRIAMCIWRWLGPAAKLIAAIGPSHDRRLPTKKTSRVVHDHGIPDVRLYRGRTEVGAVHHLRNGPLPRA